MSDNYYELTIKPEKNYELFLDLLSSLTNDAIEELDGTLIARSEEDLSDVEEGILKFAQALEIKCETICLEKENIDWIKQYQESVKSVEIGNYFVRPSWEEKKDDKIDIIIDPALSFGSGHHETTSSCIEAIDKYVQSKQTILDVGTGSGILAVAAAKKDCIVDICDTDEVCIKDTKSNFELNNVSFKSSWIGSANNAKSKYDVVIANIVADVLSMIAGDLKKCLNEKGILIISGILDKHLARVQNRFKDLEEIELIHKNEWVTIVYKNKES
ncbi:50S ribosomal protein L11 methyltransferase [Arcobacter roscoffensis]|uniref:Ribosomal protein L11 methyltransferase n=1 Tax=Arcobacter roscoffensis TaxID=2961520 RepID=A0ABY5E8J7_9BACT|nr:50S ribosomal protein L11 methyltransferase [Arcobacter roscoffensis]UTJ07091.1 50S ribosomal protein L11 methyltransferase [Arcobacter roscoffensis]